MNTLPFSKVEKLHLGPGDTLVMRVPQGILDSEVDSLNTQITNWLRSEHPGTPALVLSEDANIYDFPFEAIEALYEAALHDRKSKSKQ